MDESSFWTNRIRPKLMGMGRMLERVENGLGAGTPDIDFCIEGVHGKIELKWRKDHPRKNSSRLLLKDKGLRPAQIAWASEYLYAGGRFFVLVGTPSGSILLRPTREQLRELNEWSVELWLAEAVWVGLNGSDSYGRLLEALIE